MKILTNSFKTFLAKKTLETLTGQVSSFYTFAARSNNQASWSNTDSSITSTRFDTDREIIFGYRVTEDKLSLMIRNKPWVSGTIYSAYDDKNPDLIEEDFYVVVDESDNTKSIFMCLEVAKKYTNDVLTIQPSLIKPSKNQTSLLEDFFITSDGYKWKFLYNVPLVDIQKFSTPLFIPITANTNIANAAIFGSIHSVVVDHPGSGYDNHVYGSLNKAEIGGNSKLYSIIPSELVKLYKLQSNVNFDSSLSINISSANTVLTTGRIYSKSNTEIEISLDTPIDIDYHLPITISQDLLSVTTNSYISYTTPRISTTIDNYVGNSFYVKSGPGAGQIETISRYYTSNGEYLFELENSLSVVPTAESKISIAPRVRIIGDGVGAKAVVNIEDTANAIINIDMINVGVGYTYATATLTGNSSIIDSSGNPVIRDPAVIRPIIAPLGGYGYDIANQLFVDAICISTTFDNTAPTTNEYNKIGLIAGAVFNNPAASVFDDRTILTVTVDYSGIGGNGFIVGETIRTPTASALIHQAVGNDMYITNIKGTFTANNIIAGVSSTSRATINSITLPNRIKNICETLYVEDLTSPITRESLQTESVKLIIEF